MEHGTPGIPEIRNCKPSKADIQKRAKELAQTDEGIARSLREAEQMDQEKWNYDQSNAAEDDFFRADRHWGISAEEYLDCFTIAQQNMILGKEE